MPKQLERHRARVEQRVLGLGRDKLLSVSPTRHGRHRTEQRRAAVSFIISTAKMAITENVMIHSAGMNGLIAEPCVAFTSRSAISGVVPAKIDAAML
ncbi:MAG: hypothetical protein ACTIJ6_09805 [Leucobacter sp.]